MSKTIMSFNSIKTLFLSFVLFASFSGSVFAASFNDNLERVWGHIYTTDFQTDGKVILGGSFSFDNKPHLGATRLNTDGTEDLDFSKNIQKLLDGAPGYAQSSITTVRIQSDGDILIGGKTYPGSVYTGNQYGLGLMRVKPSGLDDGDFRGNLPMMFKSSIVSSFAIQEDGKIVVTGRAMIDDNYSHSYVFIVRLNKDGSEDTNFKSNISGIVQNTAAIVIQPDGKILVGGYFNSFNGNPHFGLIRLNPDGTEDTSFSIMTSRYSYMSVAEMYIQSDGKIVTRGDFRPSSPAEASVKFLLRFNRDGTEDFDFTKALGEKYLGAAAGMMIQSDGKILVSGSLYDNSNGGLPTKGIIRFNADGIEDKVFYAHLEKGFTVGSGDPRIIGIQNDGKILIGKAYDFNGHKRNGVVRLNADGTEDTSGRLPPPVVPPRGGPRGGPAR